MREDETKARILAKGFRRNLTRAETILWVRLRRKGLNGCKFRRQHPIGPYIADFACISARLVVEGDGETHSTDEERAHDDRREAYLRRNGWRVLRVQNHEVFEDLDDVLEAISWRLPSASRVNTREAPPP